jgi:branched-chain amino acid transport system substrate-binding protein
MHVFLPRLLRLAALGALIVSFAGTPQMVRAADPYELNAILPVTGGAAFLGTSEVRTMRVIEELTNKAGGIKGRPLKINILDDQTNPQIAVQLVTQLVSKNVPVFLGPGISATCSAIGPMVAKSGPASYCFSPAIHPPAGSFQFSASVDTLDLGAILVRFFKAHGWTRMALMTSSDTTGQDFDRVIERTFSLPEFRDMTLVAHEHFATADVTVAAQIARVQAAKPQAMIAWTTGTPLGTVLHAIHDLGLDIPIATSNSNMSYAQLNQFASFLPKNLYFPGMRAMTPEGTGPGPLRDAQTRYFNGFKAIGVRPDFGNNLSWDPTTIVVAALRALGPEATAEQIRSWIAGLHSYAGINGIYDFRAGDQRGVGQNAAIVHRWDPAKNDFVVMSRPGGRLH